ncbi:hypothetical protein F0L17_26715 [Streptomyces sp. TRM43335]|uniref:Uncharacterized protein n=1 Tax=Streptomyces taklimakanensis TaxID=2569853 RepID=A0A6G2BKN4_9ACTN|nr:hypothetical protein [Streptomyces taklimakanensis]MTE22623.1 hypothetical protein [Streptomyces taklimakanensis]
MGASRGRSAQAAEKRARAAELRMAGLTWRQVAEEVGYASPGAACKAVTDAVRASARAASVEEYRRLEALRLDRLQAAHWPRALSGDVAAALVVLAALQRQSRLLRLDVPQHFRESARLTQEILTALRT